MRTSTRGFGQLLGGLLAIFGQDLRNGVGEIEAVAVRLEAEGLDFGDAPDALLVQVVFERQYSLLNKYRAQRSGPRMFSFLSQRVPRCALHNGAGGGNSNAGRRTKKSPVPQV